MPKPLTDLQLARRARPLWRWIDERHRIFLARQAGQPPPWTKDKILQSYRFCNVFRELDTTTEWIRHNWREPMAKHEDLWFAMFVARMINRPTTLAKLGKPSATRAWIKDAAEVLATMTEAGEKVYGGAYIITAGGQEGDKWRYTIGCFESAAKSPPALNGFAPMPVEHIWQHLRLLRGCGPFIAYEIATDLRWTRYCDESDVDTWANPGPGAMRGINRILTGSARPGLTGHGKHDRISREEYIDTMRRLLKLGNKLVGAHVPALEMRDIEHSLCETDKYLRALHGEGRPKQLFRGNIA